MRTVLLLSAVACFIFMTMNAHARCGSTKEVWSGDSDGSIRLTYDENDRLELIYREEEGVIVARGFIGFGFDRREIYSLYDLNNSNLVYSKAKYTPEPEQLKNFFPSKYYIQSLHDIKVYTANNDFDAEIKTLLSQSREKGCPEEVMKLWQGRTFDKEKCGQNADSLKKVTTLLARPDKSTFAELTENVQVQRYIDKLRGKRDCDSVQDMGMKIVTEFRKPETLKRLAYKKKMPAYLEEDKGISEVQTIERYRY